MAARARRARSCVRGPRRARRRGAAVARSPGLPGPSSGTVPRGFCRYGRPGAVGARGPDCVAVVRIARRLVARSPARRPCRRRPVGSGVHGRPDPDLRCVAHVVETGARLRSADRHGGRAQRAHLVDAGQRHGAVAQPPRTGGRGRRRSHGWCVCLTGRRCPHGARRARGRARPPFARDDTQASFGGASPVPQSRARRGDTSHRWLSRIRTVAHARLSRALSALRRSPLGRAHLASRVSRVVHDRRALQAQHPPCMRARAVGRPAGDFATGSRRLSRRRPAGHTVQRPPVLARAHAARRTRTRSRCDRPPGGAGAGDRGHTRGATADCVSGSWRRTARRRVRARARIRAGQTGRAAGAGAHLGRTEGIGQLLHPALDHGVPGPAHARSPRARPLGRRDSRAARARPRDGQRRVPGGRLPISRACGRARTCRRRRLAAGGCDTRRGGSRSVARSHSAVCTASISTRWPCSSRACRCG